MAGPLVPAFRFIAIPKADRDWAHEDLAATKAIAGKGAAGGCHSLPGLHTAAIVVPNARDIDPERIAALNEGKILIYEPGLEEVVRQNRKEGRLRFSVDAAEAVAQSVVSFTAVGTPMCANGRIYLSILATPNRRSYSVDGGSKERSKGATPERLRRYWEGSRP